LVLLDGILAAADGSVAAVGAFSEFATARAGD